MFIKYFFRIALILSFLTINSAYAVLFYSQNKPSQSFADLSNWNTASNGTGISAVTGDLSSGSNVFLIQNGHTVKIDRDIDVDRLIVGQGTTNTYLEIEGSTARNIVVRTAIYVDVRGNFYSDNNPVAHSIVLSGTNSSITNLGTFRPRRNSNSLTTVTVTSTGIVSISGNSSIHFYDLIVNGGAVVTAAGSMICYGNFLLTGNSKLIGSGNIEFKKTLTVNTGSEIDMSAGTFSINELADQTVDCLGECDFYNLNLDNSPVVGVDGVKTVNGKISVENQLRIYSDASFAGSDSVLLNRNLYIDSTDVAWTGSGPIKFTGNGTLYTLGATVTLGSSELIIDGLVSLSNPTKIKLNNNLTIKDNQRLIIGETCSVAQVSPNSNNFYLGTGALLYVRGVNNFPLNFNSYSLNETSRTFYDGTVAGQLVKGGVAYGDLVISNNTKNGNGAVDVRGNLTVSNATTFRLLSPGSDLTLGGNVNGNGGTLICNNTLTLDGVDKNQTLDADVAYTFKNFVINNVGPITGVRTKNIDNNMTINGSFTINNTNGDLANYLIVDIDANGINATGTFTVGDNVRIYTSGETQFNDMVDAIAPSFSSVILSNSSTIQFDGTTTQKIPGDIAYGNLIFRNGTTKTLTGDVVINGSVDGANSGYVFYDAGHTITLYKNWNMGDFGGGLNRTNMTGNFIFAGGDQSCNESNFYNLTFSGTGTKTINFVTDIGCTLTVEDGVTVNSDYNMFVGCDLNVNGTGKLRHNENQFTFDGIADQTISINTPKASFVNNVSITNGAGSIILNSDFDVNGYLTMNNGTNATLNISDDTLSIGGDFTMYPEDNIIATNSTIKFDGAADQTIRNGNASSVYNNMYFLNGGEKRFSTNTLDINGDVIGESSVTINQNGVQLNVAGDWTHVGSIAGNSANDIYFDGANQSIKGSEFNSVYFAGTGTKTMKSNTYIKGDLFILSGSTLDVSASNYQLTVEGNWNNDYAGYFNSRTGKVRIIGDNSILYTGGIGAGKSFHHLDVNLALNDRSVQLRDRNTDELDVGTDLDINGNLVIYKGLFYPTAFNVYLAGHLTVESRGRFLATGNSHSLYFDGNAGVKNWTPYYNDTYRSVILNATGATLVLKAKVEIQSGQNFTINNGKFDLNGNTMVFRANNSDMIINGANSELEIDAGATLTMGTNTSCDLINNGGTLTIVGTSGNEATITSSSNYTITQTGASAKINAEYYRVIGLTGNGIDVQGGTIDNTRNFSNGVFSGGVGTAYLTIYNGAFASGQTIKNVSFNESSANKPTYNVNHPAGSVLTFEDAKGSASGPSRENDDGSPTSGSVRWVYTSGFFWTGLDGTDPTNWDRPNNWSTLAVPIATSDVILDHSLKGGVYNVNVNNTYSAVGAKAGSISILNSGGTLGKITLDLNGKILQVSGDVSIGNGMEIEQSTAVDTLFVAGSFSNTSGILDGDVASVVFNADSGAFTISTNSSTSVDRDFNNVIVRGGGIYSLTDISEIQGDLYIQGGVLNLGDASNQLEIQGDFIVSDSGSLIHVNGLIVFEGTTGNQQIDFGGQPAYNITFKDVATKELVGNLSIENDVVFDATTGSVSGGEYFLFVQRHWRNLKGTTAFSQTGGGTIVFNGVNTQNIGQSGDLETIFNNVIFQSQGLKSISANLSFKGDMQILMASSGNYVDLNAGNTITGVGSNNRLLMQDGVFRLKSASSFPIGVEEVNLLGGEVRYESSGVNQEIYATEYYNLRIRELGGTVTTKTALGNIVVNNNFYNNNDVNTQLNMNCYDLTIKKGMDIRTGALQINWGTGCVTTCGTGGTFVLGENITTIDADLTSFHNIRVENNGVSELRLASNLTMVGNLEVDNGSYFDMQQYTITNTCADVPNTSIFTLSDNARLQTQVASGSTALPHNFGAYSVSTLSLVEYQRSGNQDVYTRGGIVTYGDLILEQSGIKTLDGDLNVKGIFDMDGTSSLVDAGHDITLSGSLAVFNGYSATNNLVTFDGADQTIRVDNGTTADFNEVYFTGTGTKKFWDAETYNFHKDFKVDEDVVIDFTTYNQNVSFSGDSILVKGTLNHDGNNDFRFNKNGVQVVDLGANHDIAHLEIKSNTQVQIINNGLNITGNGGTYNFVEVEPSATLDLGSLTHKFGQDNFIVSGTLLSQNADLIFNQEGTQLIDAFVANNVLFTGSGDRDMNGIWKMNDITIDGGVRVDFNGQDTLVVRGNWNSTGDLNREDGVVRFEITDAGSRLIHSNEVPFAQVKFVQVGGNQATYTLDDNLYVDDSLRLGTGAKLVANGNTFILGYPADGGGAAESMVIESGAELLIDPQASLLVECSDATDANIDVYGTLSLIGTPSQTATISRYSGSREIDIDVIGGTIAARNYIISNLVNDGLFIDQNSEIDAVNNFSDGTFSDMQERQGAVYLHIEADMLGVNDIKNISFLHSGPVVGSDFNVRRDRTDGGIVTFDNNVTGALGSFKFEKEIASPGVGDRIVWPATIETNWIGGDATGVHDWFNTNNWDGGVPDSSKIAIVGSRPFLPIIEAGGADTAFCKRLILNDNGVSLIIRDGIDLYTLGDIQIGIGNQNISVLVQSATSDIIVGGSWFMSNNSTFNPGNSTVIFKSVAGSVTVDNDDQSFYNIVFDSPSSFNISGDLDVNGNISILGGTVIPSTNNYLYTVAGNWDATGGTFSTSVNGTVLLNGATQVISNAKFDNLTVSGTLCDTIKGNVVINDELIINSCVIATTGSYVDMNDDVTINTVGSFNDGGGTHTFSGVNWRGLGAFPLNTGTINFDRTGGTQNIFAAKFNNLAFIGTSTIRLEGNVDVTANVTINNSINRFYTQQKRLVNTTGTGVLFLGASEYIYVNGANNFPAGFSTYQIDPTSYTFYDGTVDQVVLGGFDYGHIYFQNVTTKTIDGGNVGIKGHINIAGSTFDVSSNNYSVSVAGNWNNNAAGSFIARKGIVTFDGSTGQYINVGDHPTDGNKKFWSVTVANTSIQNVDVNGGDIYIDSTLKVVDGTFTLAGVGNGFNAYVGGSLQASGSGTFANSGDYYLKSTVNSNATSPLSIAGNGSIFNNIRVQSSANTIYKLNSDLTVNGNFDLQSGQVKLNGYTAELGTDINDAVTVKGTLALSAGSRLLLGNQTSLTVGLTGRFEAIGSSVNPAIITKRYATGDYNFSVSGQIAAQYYVFESMSTQGILVFSSATIDNTNNFSNGVFTRPSVSGVCLRIENTQKFTTAAGNRIENVSFPVNPGSGTINVAKTLVTSDSVEFYNATGSMSGENYENDPNDLIFWTGPKKLTWTGAKNTNWYDNANWSASSGPDTIPDSTYDVQIPFVTNQPIITISGASSKSLRIEAGAFVIVATPNDTAADLVIHGELLMEGILRTNTSNDEIEVRGNWSRVDGGNYSYGSGGRIVFANEASTLSLNNGVSPFYDLVINNDGNSIVLATDIVINNDLLIKQGTLDVTTSNYKVTIGGSFRNDGVFKERKGTVLFTTNNTDTVNAVTTKFYNFTMNGTGILVLGDQLRVNNIADITKGIMTLNSELLLVGDASGTDLLRVNGGTLSAGVSSSIKLASNASILVSNGGKLQLIGADLDNRVLVTNQSGSGKYSFTIANGGVLEAKFYTIEYLAANGVNFQAGSFLDPTNNLSYGTLTNGTSGGTFITFNNNQTLSGNDQIEYVEFSTNPGGGASNAKKTTGSGNVKFYYTIGTFQGEDFDNDPNDKIVWDADIKWTGAVSSDWNNSDNWDPLLEILLTGLVPTILTDVIIPDAGTVPNNPVLFVNGLTDDLFIETGGLLTINADANLTVNDSVIVEGTLTIDNGSNTDLSLGGSWVTDLGIFNAGNTSEVIFTADAGVESIITNDAFCGIRINSSAPSTGTIQTGNPLNVDCDLSIDAGILLVANSAHTINLSGNWDNNRTTANTGFNAGTGTVVFDGASDQSISHVGGSETFYNLTISNSGSEVNLDNHINISNNLVIDDNAKLTAQTSRISINGDWTNNNLVASTGFDPGTARVRFTGSSMQTLSHAGGHETLNDVILNNSTSGTSLLLNVDLTIEGFFAQTDGIVTTNGNELILTNTVASDYSGFSNTSFVNGVLTRYIATNTSTYSFPVAQGTALGDYFRIDMINNNLTGVTYITGSVAGITESGDNIDGNIALEEYNGGATYLSVAGETAIWTLSPNLQPVGGSYGIRAYVDNFGDLVDDLFALVKRNEGSTTYADWDDNGATTTLPAPGEPGRTLASGYALRLGWTSFSEFGIGITDIPLPIELLSFDVNVVSNSVHISWTTLTEKNNDYFTVERSMDGVNFVPVGFVNGAGNSLEALNYSFIDSKPVSGVSYYRLRQTDFDGKTETFEIKAVSLELASFSSVYPNPASSVVYITSANNDLVSVEIYSLLGTQVFASKLEGQDQSIDITGLPSGVYTVVVSGINWVQKEKLVITK